MIYNRNGSSYKWNSRQIFYARQKNKFCIVVLKKKLYTIFFVYLCEFIILFGKPLATKYLPTLQKVFTDEYVYIN